MKLYESLFKRHREQEISGVFAHFYAVRGDYDESFKIIARQTIDGLDAWYFHQPRFQARYTQAVPKLRNYLNYTFKRLVDLEQSAPGTYFHLSSDREWITFNTGLSNTHGADLLATFQRYKSRGEDDEGRTVPDWVFKGCFAPNDNQYREHFGTYRPDIAWYSLDSRDFVFDITYSLEKDMFDHLFDRAKDRAGMPTASDESVRNYIRGALEGLVPKIRRNYKVAIPIFYVEEKRMQMLLPFTSLSNGEVSCFLVDRDDANRSYQLKTVYDLDHAYFSARLITRPDKEWLDP